MGIVREIMIMPKISINEAAKLLGVSADTLRRWEESGKIEPERTEGGHEQFAIRNSQFAITEPPTAASV